jgi:uncharacterized membrane protein
MRKGARTFSRLGNRLVGGLLIALSVGCAAMVAFRPYITGEVRYLFMLWNLFLAWLPYAASVAAVTILRSMRPQAIRHAAVGGLAALWLLFLPNAAYLTTDLIHLISNRPLYAVQGTFGYLVWYDLVLFFLFSWCGVFLGFLSTYPFHRLVSLWLGSGVGWGFVVGISVLCGYGVFLGRMVRLNSWDALFRPMDMIGEVLGNLHWQGFWFSVLFSLFIGVTYLFLYHLQERKT